MLPEHSANRMVRLCFQKTCHQCGDMTKNMFCSNELCLDFGVIRILITTPILISCDTCKNSINENTAWCDNRICDSYGEREDDYFDEDDMMMELLLDLMKTTKEDEETVIDERCRTFISENEYARLYRCHSTMKEDYLNYLKSKVQMVRSYLHQCKIGDIIPNEWRVGGVRRRQKDHRRTKKSIDAILKRFYTEFGML